MPPRKPKPGQSLADLRPDLAAEWDKDENGDLHPTRVTLGTVKPPVGWRCKAHGHTWTATVNNRTSNGTGCPFCAGKRAWPGFNDLAALRPDLADEWDQAANGDLHPTQVTLGHNKPPVGWRCKAHGHTWTATLNNRTSNGTGCPECAKLAGWGTSLAEQALRRELGYLYTGTHDTDIRIPRTDGRNGTWQCDIAITLPGGRTALIEYDGDTRGHNDNEDGPDARKSADLRGQGYLLIRVRANRLTAIHGDDIEVSERHGHHSRAATLAALIADRLTSHGYPPDREPLTDAA